MTASAAPGRRRPRSRRPPSELEIVTPPEPVAAASAPAPSLIDAAWGFAPDAPKFILSTYRPYQLPPVRPLPPTEPTTSPSRPCSRPPVRTRIIDAVEAVFQISFKTRLWTTDDRHWGAWIAYTQQSHWQVYNDDVSRPFRETNYMPTIFLSYRPGLEFAGFHWRLLNFGYVHQSNGRSDILSRSWDRLFAEFGIERGNFALLARPWYRIPESSSDDDNEDITDYYGYGDLTAIYKIGDHSLSLMGRGNIREGKGAAQFTWMSPPLLGPLRAYVKGFTRLRRKHDRLQLEPVHHRLRLRPE